MLFLHKREMQTRQSIPMGNLDHPQLLDQGVLFQHRDRLSSLEADTRSGGHLRPHHAEEVELVAHDQDLEAPQQALDILSGISRRLLV
jgi:hypothetical protein